MSNIIECRSLCFSYSEGGSETSVLDNLNFEIKPGEKLAIIGQSGCGKSTLLNLIAGLDKPSEGDVFINNSNIAKLNEKERTMMRSNNLGFVYQFHHLLNDFSALYNVALPLLINNIDKRKAIKLAEDILMKVDLKNRLQHKPSQLSGGERQRVAIARAMISEPACLLADEPTGNLDADNADDILDLIIELNNKKSTSLLIVTHDFTIANKMDRKLKLSNKKLHEV